MTQVSKVVLPEMRFNFPKASIAPKAKKVLLAVLVASCMAFVGERSQDGIMKSVLGTRYMYGSVQNSRKTTRVTLSLHHYFQTGQHSKLCYEITRNSIKARM